MEKGAMAVGPRSPTRGGGVSGQASLRKGRSRWDLKEKQPVRGELVKGAVGAAFQV